MEDLGFLGDAGCDARHGRSPAPKHRGSLAVHAEVLGQTGGEVVFTHGIRQVGVGYLGFSPRSGPLRLALRAETLHRAWPEAFNPPGTQLLSPVCAEFTWGLKGKSWTPCSVDVGGVVSLHISLDLSPGRGGSFSFPLLMS